MQMPILLEALDSDEDSPLEDDVDDDLVESGSEGELDEFERVGLLQHAQGTMRDV